MQSKQNGDVFYILLYQYKIQIHSTAVFQLAEGILLARSSYTFFSHVPLKHIFLLAARTPFFRVVQEAFSTQATRRKVMKLNKYVNKIDILLSITNITAKNFNQYFTIIFFYLKYTFVYRQ